MAVGRALLSVALILYYDHCVKYMCPAFLWRARADAFAAALRAASGRDVVVDIYGNCSIPGERVTPRGTRVRTHAVVPHELAAAVRAYHGTLGKYRPMVRSLYKLLALARTDVDFTLFWDLDVDFFPPLLQARPDRSIGAWLGALRAMRESNWRLAGRPDVASPINGGMVLIRPSTRLYPDALAILTRDPRPGRVFDGALGWELRGPPRDTVPANDPVWVHPRGSAAIRGGSWRYHGAMMDQGMWFHLTHAKHQVGGDLACLLTPGAEAEPDSAARPEFRYYHDFEKIFQRKCDPAWPYSLRDNSHVELSRRVRYWREAERAVRASFPRADHVAQDAADARGRAEAHGADAERRVALACAARSRETAECSADARARLLARASRTELRAAEAIAGYDSRGMWAETLRPFQFQDGMNRTSLCAQLRLRPAAGESAAAAGESGAGARA